jgi:hypothetical protein
MPRNQTRNTLPLVLLLGACSHMLEPLVHDYDDRRQGFGEPVPLEERVSNSFLLKD